MGRKRKQQPDNVKAQCPRCRRYYTVRREEVREDKKCWHCVRGIKLSNITDGQKKEE